MDNIVIAPLQWSDLQDIDDVEPVNDSDTDCLVQIRDVLKRHGKLDRFGVALLHSHFPLATDEIMLESVDEESRTLVTKVVKSSDEGGKIGTIWMLADGDRFQAGSWCRQYCKRSSWSGHKGAHTKANRN